MAKYFYVYSIAGAADSIVKMFNTETGAVGESLCRRTASTDLSMELRQADIS